MSTEHSMEREALREKLTDKLIDVYNDTPQDGQGSTYMDLFWEPAVDTLMAAIDAYVQEAERKARIDEQRLFRLSCYGDGKNGFMQVHMKTVDERLSELTTKGGE